MEQKIALAKLQELVNNKAVYKNSNYYKTALSAIQSPGVPQVAGKKTGSGRHSSSISWTDKVEIIFRLLQIPYETSNVSKYSGRAGDRITAILETEPESNLLTLQPTL